MAELLEQKRTEPLFEHNKAIEADVEAVLKVYHRMAFQLHMVYVILGFVAIVSSVFVTTFIGYKTPPLFKTEYLPYISFISTACITLITAFSLGNKSNNTRRAWRLLKFSYLQYKAGIIDVNELLKKQDEAEAIIGGVDFQYNPR